jgi:hypothetical protein
MLQEFNMTDQKPTQIPLPEGFKLQADMDSPYISIDLYCRLVGKLLYYTITRADLQFAVSTVSRFMSEFQQAHLDAALHILRYVKATVDYGILYKNGKSEDLRGYTDADWGSCTDTRRSTGGYVFTLNEGAITWSSKRQQTVSRSSTKSAYRSLSDGAQEAVWLKRLLLELNDTRADILPISCNSTQILSDMKPTQRFKVMIKCDNQGSIKLAKNPIFHARTKHIEIHHHFIREKILDN